MENNTNYAAMSQDDIIFFGRNKEYGAYDLRQSYHRNIRRAMTGTVLVIALAITGQTAYTHFHPRPSDDGKDVVINMTTVTTPPPVKVETPKPQPQTSQRKMGQTEAATAVVADRKPVSDDQVSNIDTAAVPIDPNTDISDHAVAGVAGETSGDPGGVVSIEVTKAAPPAEESKIFTFVETMPEYPGGEKALIDFIRGHVRYPNYELEMNIQGKAYVGFVIDERGHVSNVHMVRGVSAGIDREAMRVVQSLHDFKPGIQSGKNVKVSFVLPINFAQAD